MTSQLHRLMTGLGEDERNLVDQHIQMTSRLFETFRDSGIADEKLLSEIVAGIHLAERWPREADSEWVAKVTSNHVAKYVDRERNVEQAQGIDISGYWDDIERFRLERSDQKGWIQERVGEYYRERRWSDLAQLSREALTGLWYDATEWHEPTETARALSPETIAVLKDKPAKFFMAYEQRAKHQAALSLHLAKNGELTLDLDRLRKEQQVTFLQRTAMVVAEEMAVEYARGVAQKRQPQRKRVAKKSTSGKRTTKPDPPEEGRSHHSPDFSAPERSMAFADAFTDLRKRRRLPKNMWEPEIPSRHIGKIEKQGLVPDPERLERLIETFVETAREQGVADPESDARLLRQALEESQD